MITLLTGIHIFLAVFLILLVLLQAGKGAEVSASFGGSSQTVFGSSGAANFFTRLTTVVAFSFMATSLGLTILSSQSSKSVFEKESAAPQAQTQTTQETKKEPVKTEK